MSYVDAATACKDTKLSKWAGPSVVNPCSLDYDVMLLTTNPSLRNVDGTSTPPLLS